MCWRVLDAWRGLRYGGRWFLEDVFFVFFNPCGFHYVVAVFLSFTAGIHGAGFVFSSADSFSRLLDVAVGS